MTLPYILLITLNPPTTVTVYDTALFVMLSLSLGGTRIFLSVCHPLKCTATPCFPHMFLIPSHMPCT